MATQRLTQVLASDSGYDALLGKVNETISKRQSWDLTIVTAAMSPYTIQDDDQEILVDSPTGDVALRLPNVASSTSEGRPIRISCHSLNGHTLTTTVLGGSNINGSASLSHSPYTSKACYCLNGKWLAY